MPTKEEWQELLDNTTVTWTQQGGVNGRLFTATNGNNLFLPAAGNHFGSILDGAGSDGYYWSGSLNSDYPFDSWNFRFASSGYYMGYNQRYLGRSVRPVRSAQN